MSAGRLPATCLGSARRCGNGGGHPLDRPGRAGRAASREAVASVAVGLMLLAVVLAVREARIAGGDHSSGPAATRVLTALLFGAIILGRA